jgi:peptidoglycan-N-acetylglucosamine deacetylase
MAYPWPTGIRCAAALSFDVDGESGLLQVNSKNKDRLAVMSWARYGPKTGVPRILDMLKRREVKATFFVPGYTAELYPDVIKRIHDEGHEVGAHGYLHEPLSTLDPIQEEAALVKTCSILEQITGQKPAGFRAPLWDVNSGSLEILKAQGLLYDSSLMDDDQPYTITTPAGPLAELPVHWTNDDWEQFAYLMDPAIGSGVIETCEKAFQLWKEEFEGMYHYGSAFILTMHPELIGRPGRVMMLERLIDFIQSHEGVWLTTCAEIARHQLAQSSPALESAGMN